MYTKIYFDNKPLFLCDALTNEINEYARHSDTVFISDFSNAAVNSMIHEMRLEKVHAGIFLYEDLEKLKKTFWKKFVVIQAGGGLVRNEAGELLMIFRRGKWDLPKGKLDAGEDIETCALREVREETGLKNVTRDNFLLTTYHTYDENGKHILKESHWYSMRASGAEVLIPQQEEQITALKWVAKTEIPSLLKLSFPSVADVLTISLDR